MFTVWLLRFVKKFELALTPFGVSGKVFVSDNDLEVGLVPAEDYMPKQVTGRPSKKSLADAQKTLNDNQLKFAVWLSMPEVARRPKSRQGFADQLGVTTVTLYRWEKNPDVIMAVRWLQLNNAGQSTRVSDVLDFLYNTTMDSELWMKDRLNAAKQWLNAVGVNHAWKYDNKLLNVVQVDEVDLDSLSDEELWELYRTRAGSLGLGAAEDFADEIVEGVVVDDGAADTEED